MSPSSPIQKVWKPELYKIQLEAPTPKPLRRTEPITGLGEPCYYGTEYFGEMGHQAAESLLENTPDGSYLLRRSPNAQEYYTLSVRFNNRTKHFKIYFKTGEGHYLQEQAKHYDTIHELVADGLINFHMQLHAAPIIQQINQQTRNCYQQSPYMTLNRRKLRALSNELRKSIIAKGNCEPDAKSGNNIAVTNSTSSKDNDADLILPLIYEKAHTFKIHTFKGLNWCEFCANFLWGFTAQVPAKCVPDLKRIRGVFGTDLTTMVQLYQCLIPFVVRRCVEEVEARGMLQEGIYRVSGFADEIDALKLALDRDGEKTDMSESTYGNINVIAGTLKLYLRLLPVPLITFQAYPSFMQAARNTSISDQIRNTNVAAKKLPLAHYNCLKFMMEHLKRVASHYAANKMNEHNLATVFAPTLIATPQHMTNLTEEIFMLSSLITNCEAIFN
ncbi:beta-chimaerin-like isoform X2 [Teleopsis dalmanni]|uniref:beta-chimaerin-like isoform X2 n=1 Tax=Teleopsis dalmanni TaxID=139649 RepID=UPI0018CD62E1|nr:beta-chimaerin-like isoform X2 [Teleopsis dalmanni]XP_037939470.1 beta-chimaerin-like isoform X2 [Teleopsis dalmanni]